MSMHESETSVLSYESLLKKKNQDEAIDEEDSACEAPTSKNSLDQRCKGILLTQLDEDIPLTKDVPLTPKRAGKLSFMISWLERKLCTSNSTRATKGVSYYDVMSSAKAPEKRELFRSPSTRVTQGVSYYHVRSSAVPPLKEDTSAFADKKRSDSIADSQ